MCWWKQTIDDADGRPVDVRGDAMVCVMFLYGQNVPDSMCTILNHYGQNWLGERQLWH